MAEVVREIFHCLTLGVGQAHTERNIRFTHLCRELFASCLSMVFHPRSAGLTKMLTLASCNSAVGILLDDNGG